jgi:threonylcarbamoyladenosine tRNA methylthiotransferase MtaB
MRIALTTLGCRLNQFETDAIARRARESGYEVVRFGDDADVYVVNTCAITHEADADSRQRVRQVARRQPSAQIVVTGCYANAAPARVKALPGVSLVVANGDKHELIARLGGAPAELAGERVDVAVGALARRVRTTRLEPSLAPGRSRAYLKIQDGCDYRCSFCIVPQVRGESVSVPVAVVREQLAELVAAGVPEVVLTGVHLGTYGRDLAPRVRLSALIRDELLPCLGPVGMGPRLRLGSLDPHELDDALIDALARDRRICRHLHLPTQSGDDELLRRMRRAHTARDLREVTMTLARRVPGVSLGTDVIVGFPGESEASFARTYALLSELPLTYFHVFPYSPREGTAAVLKHAAAPVSSTLRVARGKALRELSRRKQAAFASEQLGAELIAVVHRTRHRRTGALVALTDNYMRVHVEGGDPLLGATIRVRVTDVDDEGVISGQVVERGLA